MEIETRRQEEWEINVSPKLKRFFFERVSPYCVTRWWHGLAYYDARCHSLVMVIYPLHWVVNLVWFMNYVWCRHRHKESWIDKKLRP